MCLGTFSCLRRSLATSTLYAAVCILAERFLLYRKAISCKVKKTPSCNKDVRLTFLTTLLQHTWSFLLRIYVPVTGEIRQFLLTHLCLFELQLGSDFHFPFTHAGFHLPRLSLTFHGKLLSSSSSFYILNKYRTCIFKCQFLFSNFLYLQMLPPGASYRFLAASYKYWTTQNEAASFRIPPLVYVGNPQCVFLTGFS